MNFVIISSNAKRAIEISKVMFVNVIMKLGYCIQCPNIV